MSVPSSLGDIVRRMMAHDWTAAFEFVDRQQPPSLPALRRALERLQERIYALQLRDVGEFMQSKWPDPLPELDAMRFRAALVAAEAQDVAGIDAQLGTLPLACLMAYGSAYGRVLDATKRRLEQPARETMLPTVSDFQGRLFG